MKRRACPEEHLVQAEIASRSQISRDYRCMLQIEREDFLYVLALLQQPAHWRTLRSIEEGEPNWLVCQETEKRIGGKFLFIIGEDRDTEFRVKMHQVIGCCQPRRETS